LFFYQKNSDFLLFWHYFCGLYQITKNHKKGKTKKAAMYYVAFGHLPAFAEGYPPWRTNLWMSVLRPPAADYRGWKCEKGIL
jgi:hypothetical protein